MQVDLLPEYIEMISKCIESCVRPNQLQVCFDFIHLFEIRYRGWIPEKDLLKHISDLHALYIVKQEKL